MSTITLEQLNQELETLLKTSNIPDLLSSYAQSVDLAKALNNVAVTSLAPALDQINTLQTTVGGIVKQLAEPITEVSNQLEDLASGLESTATALVQTVNLENSKIAQLNQLATGFNQLANGFKITAANIPFEQLAQGISSSALVIGEITSEIEKVFPKEMAGTMITEMSEASKELFSKITGDSDVMNQVASLKTIVTAINPSSIAKMLESEFGKTVEQIESILKEFTEVRLKELITQALDQLPFTEFFAEVDQFIQNINLTIEGVLNVGGVIENLVESLTGGLANAIQSLADEIIPDEILQQIYDLINGGLINEAFEIFSTFTNNASAVEQAFRELTTGLENFLTGAGVSLTSTAEKVNTGVVEGTPPPDIPTGESSSGQTWDFRQISIEDLSALFDSVNREIKGLVIYSTGTGRNNLLTTTEIHEQAIRDGADGIGQHFVIERGRVEGDTTGVQSDGALFKARPLELEDGSPTAKHPDTVVALLLVGGYTETQKSVDAKVKNGIIDEQTRNGQTFAAYTLRQKKTLNGFVERFVKDFPGAVVFGDNNQGGSFGPGFDVINYVRTKVDASETQRGYYDIAEGVADRSVKFVGQFGAVDNGLSNINLPATPENDARI